MSEKVVLYHEALDNREITVDPRQAAVLRLSGWKDVPRETLDQDPKDSQDLEEAVYADPLDEPEDQED